MYAETVLVLMELTVLVEAYPLAPSSSSVHWDMFLNGLGENEFVKGDSWSLGAAILDRVPMKAPSRFIRI